MSKRIEPPDEEDNEFLITKGALAAFALMLLLDAMTQGEVWKWVTA